MNRERVKIVTFAFEMRVLRFGKDTLPEFRNAIITIGSFDGFHKAHQEIIHQVCTLAKKNNGESIVITFDPHPKLILDQTKRKIKLLSTPEERIQNLSQTDLDYLIIVPFNLEFAQLLPEDYVENFLIKNFKPHTIVIGFDHRFGLNSAGNIHLLKQYEEQQKFKVIEVAKKEENGIKVASSIIRQGIIERDFELVTQQLGKPYSIVGTVVRGRQVGSQIGYPTANLEVGQDSKLLPPVGIYAAIVNYSNKEYDAMLYIGHRPTLGDNLQQTIEIHIMDFETYIYGESIEVKIISFIREDERFSNMNSLLDQIKTDHQQIKQVLQKFHLVNASHKSNATVAVVVLNYNGEELLKKFIPSVFSNLPHNASLYVVDNASTDDSLSYLEYNYPEIKRIALHKNYGFAEGYNRGLRQIEADYFLLLNSDVEVKNDFITPLLKRIQANPNNMAVQPKILSYKEPDKFEYAGAAGGLMDILGYTFAVGRMLNDVEKDQRQYEEAKEIFWSSGAAMLVNSKMFLAIGGFDEDYFAHQEEVDLCWRIQRAGGKIWYEPKAQVYHVGGGTLEYDQPRKVFLNFKNNLSTIFKNVPYYYLVLLLPLRFIIDFLISLKYLLSGKSSHFLKVIEAYITSILSTFYLMYKKDYYNTKIERISIGNTSLKGLLKGSLFIHYYLFENNKVSKIPQHYLD